MKFNLTRNSGLSGVRYDQGLEVTYKPGKPYVNYRWTVSEWSVSCQSNLKKMTVNHIFFWASAAKYAPLRSFYRAILQPIGYTEMIRVKNDALIGYGSDYPYFWLKKLPEEKEPLPTHIAFDAPSEHIQHWTSEDLLIHENQVVKLWINSTSWHCKSDPPFRDHYLNCIWLEANPLSGNMAVETMEAQGSGKKWVGSHTTQPLWLIWMEIMWRLYIFQSKCWLIRFPKWQKVFIFMYSYHATSKV